MENGYMVKRSKEDIINVLKDALFEKEEILFAYLHGSFLDGNLYNDIDIVLYLDEEKIIPEKAASYCEALGLDLTGLVTLVVDVRPLNRAPLGFRHGVFKHGRLLFSRDDDLRTDLIEYASMETMDFFELSMESFKDLAYD